MKKKYESDFIKKTIGNKIVKINKMKGGVDDYDFNDPSVKEFFLKKCNYINFKNNQVNFKVLYRKMHTLGLILFGVNLESIKASNYLPYIYYLYKDTVKFKRVSSDNMGRIVFTDITFEELSKQKFREESYTSLLLNFLSDPRKHNFNSNSRNDEFNKLLSKLNEKIIQQMQQQMQQPYQQQMQQQMQQQNIKQLTEEFNTLIKYQDKILANPFPTNQNKNNIRQMSILQQQLKRNIEEELKKLRSIPNSKNITQQLRTIQITKLEKILEELNIREENIKSFKNKKRIFNIADNTDNYICEDPTIEVNIKPNGDIFFGYNEKLILKTSDGVYKFYYKYSYRGGKFFQLKKKTLYKNQEHEIKQDGQLVEEEIDINLIPTYDILCLDIKIKNINLGTSVEFRKKLQERINIAKENISKTAEAFFKLDHSNFEKESRTPPINNPKPGQKEITNVKHKNFGKVLKRRVTEKTYILFGTGVPTHRNNRSVSSKFNYVSFREDDKVFYYEITKLNEKIPLYNFPYIIPLEDLISFILLRRMITDDKNFADVILKEAQRIIKVLKKIKYTEKITINKNPENWQYSFSSRLVPTEKYFNEQYKQISLLPKSQAAI